MKSYGGPPTPATGFAAGDVVLGELLTDKGVVITPPPRCAAYVVGVGQAWPLQAAATVQALRAADIPAEYAPRGVAVGRQLKLANAARAALTVFVGGDEGSQGKVKVKNMNSGEESMIPADELIDAVRKTLRTR